ncbi:MAG: hypothetical protein KAU28_09795 [Phycisphaerae bacterium]|nr:hypothetical protein [Phycisphaerae bacterium]
MQHETTILAAETDPDDIVHLKEYLAKLGYQVHLATSAREVIELMRRTIFTKAVVGVELKIGNEPLLSLLAHLPTMERLIGTGSPDDSEAERLSRLAGADLYLSRPASIDSLAKALWPNPCGTYVSETQQRKPA